MSNGVGVKGTPWQLFLTFLKIGAFTFGGGYAMIPLIQREVVDNRRWVSEKDILDVVAIAESTPGPIAINAATFIGFKVAGNLGALCATLGVVLPSFCIIAVVSYVLEAFQHLRAVRYAFWGIRAGVLALILKALWSLYRQCDKDWFSYGEQIAQGNRYRSMCQGCGHTAWHALMAALRDCRGICCHDLSCSGVFVGAQERGERIVGGFSQYRREFLY